MVIFLYTNITTVIYKEEREKDEYWYEYKEQTGKLGITQKQMAENLSLAQPMIAQIERGTKIPNMILGLAIARMLGCTMEDLVEDER